AMELKPGMEVIVPSLTYVATGNAVVYCGARPVFADSDPTTWNVTAESIKAAWTPKTVGVIVVHLYGLPAPVEEIVELCRERGAWLIEDCAESLGATRWERPTGTFGDAAIWSFYGNKTISTGEGGMIALRDPGRLGLARMLRGQGMDPKRRYWHPIMGYNYRMTNVAAAIGVGQLQMIEHHVGERRRVAAAYRRGLAHLAGSGALVFPGEPDGSVSSHWLFSAVMATGGATRRANVQEILQRDYGVETRPFFVPMHRFPMYEGTACEGSMRHAEFLGDHGMNFPSYTGLTDADIGQICEAIADAMRRTAN
ncbi:MAG: DegT/DnrJ/EryC1/StrS family aminotransferase, partial [Acetobacteraceae bacterium]